MKKLLLSIVFTSVICFNLPVFSNEIEEDYFDMAASYSAEGDYASAMQYLDNILRINPSNINGSLICCYVGALAGLLVK